MKQRLLFLLLIALMIVPTNVTNTAGQQRKKRRTTASAASLNKAAELDQGRRRVAEQIKALTLFLYVYGRVTKDIENISTASGQSGKEALDNARRQINSSLQNVLAGMDSLEIYFRTTTTLQPYYNRLAGSAGRVETVSQYAQSGNYDQAGRLLIEVVNVLADVQTAIK